MPILIKKARIKADTISALAGRANKTASQRKSRGSRRRQFVLDQVTMQGHDMQKLPVERIYARVCEDHLANPDRSTCSITILEYSEEEPALQCRRQDGTPDSSSLKPGSGATEGVLDKGVSGQPDYIHRPNYRSVKIQDSRLRLMSGWDSPLRGRQAWRSVYYVSFLVN